MSGDKYHITDQHAIYFLTFTVVDWVDIFTRKDYKLIITDSLNHCIEHKGMECYAWVVMTNHVHLILRAIPPARLSDIIRDFKKFTSKKIIETIRSIGESREEWLLHKFAYAASSTGRAEFFKVWKDDNQNPVRQMIVAQEADYIFSSAHDYAGGKQGLVKIILEL
jgi:putative transposase